MESLHGASTGLKAKAPHHGIVMESSHVRLHKVTRFFVRRPVSKIKDLSQCELLNYMVNEGWAQDTNPGKIPAIPISGGVAAAEHKRTVFHWKQLEIRICELRIWDFKTDLQKPPY